MQQYKRLLSRIVNTGQKIQARGLSFLELIDEKLIITNEQNFYSCSSRDVKHTSKYLLGELAWYFSGNRYVNGINKYSKFWNQIANKDETANSNYGYLVFYRKKYEYTNYEWCLESLLKDQYTRQAVMLYNSKEFYYAGNKDFVCTQTQQFFIRDGRLTSIVNIRSSDAIKGLTFDIPWWSLVQQKLWWDLCDTYDIELGELIINIGSAHVYTKDIDLVNNMLKEDMKMLTVSMHDNIILGKDQEFYEKNLVDYVTILGKD